MRAGYKQILNKDTTHNYQKREPEGVTVRYCKETIKEAETNDISRIGSEGTFLQ